MTENEIKREKEIYEKLEDIIDDLCGRIGYKDLYKKLSDELYVTDEEEEEYDFEEKVNNAVKYGDEDFWRQEREDAFDENLKNSRRKR